jgi:hypothetical protein
MIDVALIELEQLLGCSVDELIALVKPMSADSCEQYARATRGPRPLLHWKAGRV